MSQLFNWYNFNVNHNHIHGENSKILERECINDKDFFREVYYLPPKVKLVVLSSKENILLCLRSSISLRTSLI